MATFPGHLYHPSRPRFLTAIIRVRRLPAWWREVVLVLAIYLAYDVTRGLRDGSVTAADGHGRAILDAERYLHINIERSLNQGLSHTALLAVIANYFYATLHFVITPAVLIWLYRRHPASYGQARTTLAMATITGLIIFWLLPTTPPRLLPGHPFHDTMASVAGWGWWGGAGSAPKGLGGVTNQLAAMPSLHVGWALWSGYWIFRYARRRPVRWLGAAYPFLTALVVMATANHYLLDAVAGVLDVALAGWVVSRCYGHFRPRRVPGGSPSPATPALLPVLRNQSAHPDRS